MNEQPGGLVLNLECTLNAPRERIFRMLTEPSELVKWWGPHGFTIPEAELNLVVGGSYRFAMKPPDGEPFHLSGEFLEIDPPWRLVYTFAWEEPTADDREKCRRSLPREGRQCRCPPASDYSRDRGGPNQHQPSRCLDFMVEI
ncbi:SRPBCC family protein [Arthrobacter sp. UYCu723]